MSVNIKTEDGLQRFDSGTSVIANPTLSGTEDSLESLQVGDTAYKIPKIDDIYHHIVGSNSESFTESVPNQYDIDVSSYENGIYLAVITPVIETANGLYGFKDFNVLLDGVYIKRVYTGISKGVIMPCTICVVFNNTNNFTVDLNPGASFTTYCEVSVDLIKIG